MIRVSGGLSPLCVCVAGLKAICVNVFAQVIVLQYFGGFPALGLHIFVPNAQGVCGGRAAETRTGLPSGADYFLYE
jgi:hypothetical protein